MELKKQRSITSLFALTSFIYLVPSGVFIHFLPKTTDNSLYHLMMSIHWISSVIFLIAVILHILINWKSMKNNMISKVKDYSVIKGQFVAVMIITTVITLLFGFHNYFI